MTANMLTIGMTDPIPPGIPPIMNSMSAVWPVWIAVLVVVLALVAGASKWAAARKRDSATTQSDPSARPALDRTAQRDR